MNATRIWALGTAVVIAAILGLGYLLGIAPLLGAAAIADGQRAEVEQNNLAQSALLASMKADYDRLDEIQEEIDALRVSMPSEVDSDFVYAYLAGIQLGSGAVVDTILTGQAVPYGQATGTDGGVTAEAAPAADDPAATGAAAAPTAIEGLYTVPVTLTFTSATSFDQVMAFAAAMQLGPRVFLVTAIQRSVTEEGVGTITAFMFVISHPDESPGSTFGENAEAIKSFPTPRIPVWGEQDPDDAAPAPTPTPTAEPQPSASPTPTPTP